MEVFFRTGLSAYDFKNQRVIIQHSDGSRLEFSWSFLEEDHITASNGRGLNIIKVYTEHNGNYWFPKEDLEYYKVEPCYYTKSLKNKIKKVYDYWKSL